jgi:polyhydroxyalkanoate synthesis regulator phasin
MTYLKDNQDSINVFEELETEIPRIRNILENLTNSERNFLYKKDEEIKEITETLEKKINSLEEKINSLEEKINSLEEKIKAFGVYKLIDIENRILLIEAKLYLTFRKLEILPVDTTAEYTEKAINTVESKIQALEKEIQELKTSESLYIENTVGLLIEAKLYLVLKKLTILPVDEASENTEQEIKTIENLIKENEYIFSPLEKTILSSKVELYLAFKKLITLPVDEVNKNTVPKIDVLLGKIEDAELKNIYNTEIRKLFWEWNKKAILGME